MDDVRLLLFRNFGQYRGMLLKRSTKTHTDSFLPKYRFPSQSRSFGMPGAGFLNGGPGQAGTVVERTSNTQAVQAKGGASNNTYS